MSRQFKGNIGTASSLFQLARGDDAVLARDHGTEKGLTRTRRRNQKVINFLINCGNKNLQYLLVPSRLDKALAEMDTDRDGHIDIDEWCVSASEPLGCLRRGDGVLVA